MAIMINKLIFVLIVVIACNVYESSARALSPAPCSPSSSLADRLKLGDDESADCWGSLLELQACSAEIIMFFLNGETYLGPDCCDAIRIIVRHCWPAMIGSLGYTTEETDILEGYCHAAAIVHNEPPPPPPPTLHPNNKLAP